MIEESSVSSNLEGWIEFIEREIHSAAAAMSSELGEQSMCTVHKDGRVTGGLKYQEGRMNAFAAARRLARGPDDIEAGLVALGKRWREELDRRRGVEQAAVQWVSYATGGAEASKQALDVFRMGPGK